MEPVKLAVGDDFRKKRKQMIFVAAVAVIISTSVFFSTQMDTGRTVNVFLVDLHIDYAGGTSGYLGPDVQYVTANFETLQAGNVHTFTVTLSNHGTTTHTVSGLSSATQGFSVVSINPDIPITLQPGSSQKMTIQVQLPDYNYSGNLNLTLVTS
ncbi:MAG: hypothetical protein QW597_06090 [Thermoplasmataceae archaeon]